MRPLISERAVNDFGWALTFLFLLVAVVASVVAGSLAWARSRRDDDGFSFSFYRVPDSRLSAVDARSAKG